MIPGAVGSFIDSKLFFFFILGSLANMCYRWIQKSSLKWILDLFHIAFAISFVIWFEITEAKPENILGLDSALLPCDVGSKFVKLYRTTISISNDPCSVKAMPPSSVASVTVRAHRSLSISSICIHSYLDCLRFLQRKNAWRKCSERLTPC